MSRYRCLAGIEKVLKFRDAAHARNQSLLKELADVKDACNRGALHFAAGDGLTDVCKYLLEALKLDVNVKDNCGTTPLAFAAERQHTATAKYLVDYGASVQTEYGNTALHYAAGNGDMELMKFLLAKDVNANFRNDWSRTPLVWATAHNQQDAVKLLLEHGANPNGHPEDDRTPLEGAITAGSVACLELLIKAGADVNFAAGGAHTLHIAAYNGDPEIINYLLQAGANPDGTSSLMFSNDVVSEPKKPILVAAARGNKEAVKILFPVTMPIDDSQDWSVDGILGKMEYKNQRVVFYY